MSENKKLIAFTFDDAPAYEELGDNPTSTILETLNSFNGKATFFLTGARLRKYGRKIVDEILKQGHEIANHSETHKNLVELSCDEIKDEILPLQQFVNQEFGIEMKYFRPAGLRTSKNVFTVTNELKMPVICGSHKDAYLADWDEKTTPEHIKRHCLDNIYPGQIILMHSYSKGTQAVFYEICETLTKDGYKFVTLSDLFKAYGVKELPYDLPIIDAQLTKI